jgi:hypothetical protein
MSLVYGAASLALLSVSHYLSLGGAAQLAATGKHELGRAVRCRRAAKYIWRRWQLICCQRWVQQIFLQSESKLRLAPGFASNLTKTHLATVTGDAACPLCRDRPMKLCIEWAEAMGGYEALHLDFSCMDCFRRQAAMRWLMKDIREIHFRHRPSSFEKYFLCWQNGSGP